MIIKTHKPDMRAPKELKVRVPLSCHVRLHSMKILSGRQISDVVTEALDDYFARMQPQESADAVAILEEEALRGHRGNA